jgi:hypothetical protein
VNSTQRAEQGRRDLKADATIVRAGKVLADLLAVTAELGDCVARLEARASRDPLPVNLSKTRATGGHRDESG